MDEDLAIYEAYWKDLCPFLEAHGYALRSRYRPGWEPSWKVSGPGTIRAAIPEDSIGLPLYAIGGRMIDATRVLDGKKVFLKRVPSSSKEVEICRHLSSDELRQDPHNHCVPLLDVLVHPTDTDISFLVTPLLREINDPEFDTLEDMFEFGEQILDGLLFIHEHNVAHRDCASRNIMMDATPMFPRGYHPVYTHLLPDASGFAPIRPRSSVRVTYYFIDFGISSRFAPGDESRLVLGKDCLEKTVPELSDTVPYDPFKTDVYILGALLRKHFLNKFSNVQFIAPLVTLMTAQNPSARPDAAQVLQAWRFLRKQITARQRRWRLKPRSESIIGGVFRDALALLRDYSEPTTPER